MGFTQLPQEIFDDIGVYSSPLDVLNQKEAGIAINEHTLKHAKLFAAIFKTMEGLDEAVRAGANPVLAGYDLLQDIDAGGKIHVFLLMLDWNRDSMYTSPKIMDCLKDHDLDRAHNARIHGTNITVNVCDVVDVCYASVSARDHSVYQSIDQLVTDGVTAILSYLAPKEVQVVPIRIDPSKIDMFSPRPVVIKFAFERYTLRNPEIPGQILEWIFFPEWASREGEEDHERYVDPGGRDSDRDWADQVARRFRP